MNQELMTLDFWQDTVIYESKTFPVGTLACDALNVPVNTIAKINEQCEKINLLLGILNAGQDASALCPMAKESALTMLDILSQTPPFSYMKRKYVFHISAEITTILSKLLDFIFRRKECGKIPMR